MNCPVCRDVALVMSERVGIEVDYCPACRGVWLDRGELDKILERSGDRETVTARAPQPAAVNDQRWDDDDDDDRSAYAHRGDDRKRRKRSMFGELFDF